MAFVQDVAKKNDGVNYLLEVIDVLSKYVWVRPMKNKTACGLLEAFGSILSEGRKPEKLRTYEGTELSNESFHYYLEKKKHSILCCKQQTKGKCKGTSESKLYRYFTAVNSLCYVDVLQDLVDSYTYHRSIGRAPATNKTTNLILNFTPENMTAF